MSDWYISGGGGLSILTNSDFRDEVSGVGVGTGETSFKNGFALTGAVGKKFNNMRLEGELSYRRNDLDKLTISSATVGGQTFIGNASASLSGDTTSFGLMANGYYDFANESKWTPFVMAGVGLSRQSLYVTKVGNVSTSYNQSDTVFAYQVGAGIGYSVTDSTKITAQYRFYGTSDPTFSDGTDKITGEYFNHNLLIGFTHSF